jgi:hypothetical protein
VAGRGDRFALARSAFLVTRVRRVIWRQRDAIDQRIALMAGIKARNSLPLAVQCNGTCEPTSTPAATAIWPRRDRGTAPGAVLRREVAGLADRVDQSRAPRDAGRARRRGLVENASRRSAGPMLKWRSSTSRARKPPSSNVQADAVRGAFRQLEPRAELGQRRRPRVGEQREQAQAALGRRAVGGRATGSLPRRCGSLRSGPAWRADAAHTVNLQKWNEFPEK